MNLISKYWIVIAPSVITLAMSLGNTYDGISPIKFLLLGFFAAFGLNQLVKSSLSHRWKVTEFSNLPPIAFLISLNLPLIFSEAPLLQQLFGVTGRNLGYFHYFFLTVLLMAATVLSNDSKVSFFLSSLLPLGLFESFYGLIQKIGLDPLPWKNPGSWMLGTFGNPNYLSSFLALSSIASLFSITKGVGSRIKFLHAINLASSSIAIFFSNSSQGLILLGVGFFAIALRYLVGRRLIFKVAFLLIASFAIIIMFLGLLQVGPAKPLIYQSSVSVRGDYWRAGISMIKSHFFFGVGLDSYGDSYRMFRDIKAVSRNGLDSFSNSAHNVYIDLFATGGAFLFLSYLALNALVFKKIVSHLHSQHFSNDGFNALATIWFAYQVQSVVSINVAGLAIWGWIAAGLILGFRERPLELKRKIGVRINYIQATIASALIMVFLLPGLLLIRTQARMASALSQNDFSAIAESFSAHPRDSELMGGVAQSLLTLKQELYALTVARRAVQENPMAVRAWKVILESSASSRAEKDAAAKNIKSLDPFLYLDIFKETSPLSN